MTVVKLDVGLRFLNKTKLVYNPNIMNKLEDKSRKVEHEFSNSSALYQLNQFTYVNSFFPSTAGPRKCSKREF